MIRHSRVGEVVVWPGCTESCVGQVRKGHRRLVGHAPWSSIGHGQVAILVPEDRALT